MSTPGRGSWRSNLGFVLAAAGSAIGLGNIWKFPYITGVYGGGAFVLVYLGCVALVGLPLMYAEVTIGRAGQSDAVGSLKALARGRGTRAYAVATGGLGVLSAFLILSFYSVVAGWAIHFLVVSLRGFPGGAAAVEPLLGELLSAGDAGLASPALWWHTLFMGLTVFIVAGGVQRGIELACKVMMPLLALLLVVLMLIGLGMEGGPVAVGFMFGFDASHLGADAILEALGHSFFTLSLGMGAMITYGSYLGRGQSIAGHALAISIADTAIALIAGLAIFSITFTHCLAPGSGPTLLFATLPVQFARMTGGAILGVMFFTLVVFAALTSAISLLEVVTAFMVDRFGVRRRTAAVVFGAVIYALGIASVFSPGGVLAFLDDLTTRYTLPLGGLLVALFAGFALDREVAATGAGGQDRWLFRGWLLVIRYVTPILVIAVLLNKAGVLTFTGGVAEPEYPTTETCAAKAGSP